MKRKYPVVIISEEGASWLEKVRCGCIKYLESIDEDAENGTLVDIISEKWKILRHWFSIQKQSYHSAYFIKKS